MAFNLVTVTGSFTNSSGGPATGRVTFTPPGLVTDLTGTVKVLGAGAYSYTLSGGSFTSAPLLATDNHGLLPADWTWTVTVRLTGQTAYSYPVLIPFALGSTVNLASLPSSPAQQVVSSVVLDPSAGDIQPAPGVAAAGGVGKAADSGHVHPQPPVLAPTGLTGAVAASRYAGATGSGAPASGTFVTGDYVIDQTGTVWICTAGGSPGSWVQSGSSNATAAANTAAAYLPQSTGYVAWTGDRWTSSRYGATYLSAYPPGSITLCRMVIPFPVTCTGNVDVMWSPGVGTAGANGYLAVFNSAGVMMGPPSADISGHGASWITLATGVTSWPAGNYYCAFVIGTQFGTTGCGPAALGGETGTNSTTAPGDSQPLRTSRQTGSLTAMPSSLVLTSGWTTWFMMMEFLLR